ncbi:BRO family protein [Glaciimonas soli]|uniref:Phage antirepressor protein n=1 Tax=Glaciimonas soli TaxID=2590999 RepID=A0A843YYM3_9BURK|nr:phage antirepressor [Glaciimonas soli]MQR02361.1 phage antirepressor protein [Glaciimonas soli]
MNTTQATFTFVPGLTLRVVTGTDNNPWFAAKDVCMALSVDNPTKALSRLKDDEKGLTLIQTLGGKQKLTAVTESGLYSLIMTSRKPVAQEFKKWVTSVVLPAIRKDGAYIMGEEKVATGEMSEDELIFKAFTALKTKSERLMQELAAAQPAVEFHENYVGSAGTQTLTEVAKGLGIAPKMFFDFLQSDGVLYRRSKHMPLLPKSLHAKRGYFEVKQDVSNLGFSKPQTRVTPAGFVWLSERYGHIGRQH